VSTPASKVGNRLRAERERRGISLRELARRVGVSPSLVSQIELDRVNPSVSTLYSLVTELGMTMSDVFGDGRPAERAAQQPRSSDGLAERPETRRVINLASGVRWERLTPGPDHDTDFLFVTYDVDGSSSEGNRSMRHSGHEYGLILSGKLEVTVGFDHYELGPGDSISFDSTVPHHLTNRGDEPVRGVWVVVGRQDDGRRTMFGAEPGAES